MPMKKKTFMATVVCAIFVLSIIAVAHAQTTISKPSVPEFSLEFISQTINVAPSFSINPYTGENVTYPGYQTQNNTIQIKIQNQLFIPIIGNETLYYNARVKGHFEDEWTEIYRYESTSPGTIVSSGTLPPQSKTQFTMLSYPAMGYPEYSQLDFQVEALIGIYTTSEPASHDPFVPPFTTFGIIAGGESGWSKTQTITIPEPSPSPVTIPSPSPSPTQEPTTEPTQSPIQSSEPSPPTINPYIILIPVLIAVVAVIAALVYFKKHKKQK
jgi:hypothetical protein